MTMGGSGFSGLGPLSVSEKGSVSKKDGGLALLSKDDEVCLAWLVHALQQLRSEGQTKVVGYLEAVSEEVAFEIKALPQSRPTVRKASRGDGKRVPVLGSGERSLERHPDRRNQPGLVRALRVAGRAERR